MYFTIKKLLDTGTEKEATIYINFENRKLLPLTPEYFNDIIDVIHAKRLFEKHTTVFIFLDEVQRIRDWEKYIRSIYDEFKGKIKIFISGSTSNFREYSEFGGFPEVALLGSGKEELIQTLFSDIINRDILPKAKRRGEIIEDLAYFLCSNSGKLASFTKLTGTLNSMGIKLSVPTFEKYFSIMKEAFLFFDLTIYSYKVKDQMQYPRKIYCVDPGFINFAGFKFSENRGRLMENLVAIELQRTRSKSPLIEIFYWKDQQGREVDFVIRDGLPVKQLIQVTNASNREEIQKREITGLLRAEEEFKCSNLLVITWEYEGEEIADGCKIVYRPLWKWLMEFS
jgi:predicted AAA+ superfamily ATPase